PPLQPACRQLAARYVTPAACSPLACGPLAAPAARLLPACGPPTALATCSPPACGLLAAPAARPPPAYSPLAALLRPARHPLQPARRPLRPARRPLLLAPPGCCPPCCLHRPASARPAAGHPSPSLAPPATANNATRSQWLTRHAAAHLAIRNHLPLAECAHFGQHKIAKALYDAVFARYSSPATIALGCLILPYPFPEMSAFATVEDLVTHLRTSDARYCAALPEDFLDNPPPPPPPMYITLYFIVTRLPDSLRAVRDQYIALDPTDLTVDLLEQHLLAAETSVVAIGAARGTPRTPFFEGMSGLLLLVGSASAARARVAGVVEVAAGVVVGATVEVVEVVEVVAAVGVVAGVGVLVATVVAAEGVAVVAAVGVVAFRVELLRGEVLAVARGSNNNVGASPLRPSSFVSGFLSVGRLGSGVDIIDLDYNAILAAMYALSVSAEGDCYLCVPPDQGIEAAALGACESALPGTAPTEALHTFTLDSEPPQVAAYAQVSASGPVAPPCSCRLLTHQTLLWHHRLGHPSLPHLRGIQSHLLVSRLPRSLPPLLPSHAPPCLPCVEGRQRAAPPSSSFPPTSAPLQTLHMDVWGPARVSGQGRERYFLLVVDDNTRYTTIFPLRSKGEVPDVLIPWIRTVRLQLRERFRQDLRVLRLHSDRGGEFSSDLLWDFCRGEGSLQSFTLPDSPQQNGIAERRIGLFMEVARTSMIHAAAPHFLWPFAVWYAAHKLNLWPRVSLPETSPTLHWTGKVGDASVFRVWGSRAFVRDTCADKLSVRAVPCAFLGFSPDAPGWQFYYPTSRCVFPSHDITFDESVPFNRLFPYRSAPPPPPPLFLALGPPPVDPLPPQGPAPLGVSEVDPLPGTMPVEVAVDSSAARGAASGGGVTGGAEPGGAEPRGVVTGGAESEGAGSGGAEPVGVESGGAEHEGVEPRGAESGGAERRGTASSRAIGAGDSATQDTGAGGAGVTTGAGGTGGAAATGHGGACTRGTRAAGTGRVGGAGARDSTEPGAAGARDARDGGTSAGARAGGAGAVDPGAGGAGAGGAVFGGTGARGTMRLRPYFVPLLQQVLCVPSSPGLTPPLLCPPPDQPQPLLQLASALPTSSPYTAQTGGLIERREPASRPASPVRTGRRVPCPRHPRYGFLSFSTAASALVAELIDFAGACRLDYATALVAEYESASLPYVGGECALGMDVLDDRQEDLECLASAVPRFASVLLAPEGDPDAPDISTSRSYAEAITDPYSSQWQAAMDAEMASWKSTSTYVDIVPLSLANIDNGMWIFRVKRPPGSPPAFKACYVTRGFSQR
ncbi:unnamed protein product, partial [Closterium sp. NIES-54]